MRNKNSLEIPYTSEDFPSKYNIGSGILTTSWDDILWAALTIGRPPSFAYLFRHGKASLYEALFRLSLIRMAIEQDNSGRLKRTDAFAALDPSEKGAVSYFLGMAICKFFVSKLLKTPWLLHLDVFRSSLKPTLLGGSRPDLVGFDKFINKRYAFESKGRSYPPSSSDIEKAKGQAQRLVTVDNRKCLLQIGTFAYFKSGILHFHWRDPVPEGDSLELVSPEHKWRHYFEPVLALVLNSETSNLEIDGSPLPIYPEIHPDVHRFLLADSGRMLMKLRMKFVTNLKNSVSNKMELR